MNTEEKFFLKVYFALVISCFILCGILWGFGFVGWFVPLLIICPPSFAGFVYLMWKLIDHIFKE